MRTDRVGSGSGSTQRWRQVKQGLKMLGQKKRDERATVDYQKSAQLMAELLPARPQLSCLLACSSATNTTTARFPSSWSN